MKASQITASVFVECLLSLYFFAQGAFMARAYAPLKAEIPVLCQDVTARETQIYQIEINPENELMPAPVSGSIAVAENSTGKFEIEITEPGTYRYLISENAGSDTDIRYDDSVYEVTVFVENGAGDSLVCAVIANTLGRAEKAEQISFQNLAEEIPGSVTTATSTTAAVSTETTTTVTEPVTTAAVTTATQPAGPITSIINSLRTGDRFPAGALCAGLAALTVLLSAFLFRRKKTEKEGGK